MQLILSSHRHCVRAPYGPHCSPTFTSSLSHNKIATTCLAASSDRSSDEQSSTPNNLQGKPRVPKQQSQQQNKRQQPQQQAQQQQPRPQQPNRQKGANRGGPVLRWRSGTPPAAAGTAPGQQQRDSTAYTSGSGIAAAGPLPPSLQKGDAGNAAAAATAASGATGAGTSTVAATQYSGSSIDLFTPASSPPGFFRPQTTTATAEEADAFLLDGINEQFATPSSLQEQTAAQQAAEQEQHAELAAAKQKLPPEYQARLAAAAANAAAVLAAAEARAGGLSAEQLAVAETAAAVAAGTRSPFTAEMAQDVVADIAAGREPDPECVELLLDPLLLEAEQNDTVGPEFDQLFFSTMEGNPAGDLDWLGLTGEGLLEYFEEGRHWESLARLFTTARGCAFLQLPHLLVLLQRLPGLVRAEELGFRARLRLEVVLGEIMEEVLSHSTDLTPSHLSSICLAVGRLKPPLQPFDYGQPLQTLVDQHLPALTVRQCADILWGLGKAGVKVDARWLSRVWTHMMQKRRELPRDTLGLAKGLFACALLTYAPPRQQLQPFYAACIDHASAFSPLQLSNTLWAVAALELQPPASWLHAVLTHLLLGQIWSTDGVTVSIVQPAGLVKHWKDDVIAESAAAAAAASADVELCGTTAAAAAGINQPDPAAAAAVSRAFAAALSAPVPAAAAAAADAAAPSMFQSPSEGPAPIQPDSMNYHWLQLLAASRFGSSNIPDGVLQLPYVFPNAPHSLLTLSPVQLADLVDALASLQLSSDNADVAASFDQIWSAAVAVTIGSSSSSSGSEEHDTAAALPVVQLQEILQQQQQQQQPKQRQNKQGFGSSRSQRQQQQQKQRQDSSNAVQLLNPEVLSQFNSLTNGLWETAVAEDWSIGQLATAASMRTGSSSSGSSSSAPIICNSWIAANRAVADCMEAWYAASEVVMPHMEPVALVRTLVAVATMTNQDTSPVGPRFPDELLQQWNVTYRPASYQPTQLAAAAAAGEVSATLSQEPWGMEAAAAHSDDSRPQQQQQQLQQQRECRVLLLPPLPPGSWLAAAVQRLVTTRSAYSELALLRAFEALAELLGEHPQREALLEQQQQRQQWWWQTKQLEWEEESPMRPPPPPATAAVAAGQHRAAAVATGAPPVALQTATSTTVSSSGSSSSSAGGGDKLTVLSPGSWLHAISDSSSGSGTRSSSDSGGCGDPTISSSSSSSSSILPGLCVLSRCLGHVLGELLPPAMLVQAACTLASVSPVLLSPEWLQQHEAKLVLQLQQQGWSAGSSSKDRNRKRSTPAAAAAAAAGSKSKFRSAAGSFAALSCSAHSAAAAGLNPSAAYLLLDVHEQCGYRMQNAALLEACRELASAGYAND